MTRMPKPDDETIQEIYEIWCRVTGGPAKPRPWYTDSNMPDFQQWVARLAAVILSEWTS